ncbi:hypothetical protein Tco_1351355 [Tanacetum coccineum]
MELILDIVLDKLDDSWFKGTIDDEDDLNGIVDYLELKPHDGIIDIEDETYKERMCKLLGMTYKEPYLILIEKVEVTRYTIGPGKSYTKVKILEIDEVPRASTNVAFVRGGLREEMNAGGGKYSQKLDARNHFFLKLCRVVDDDDGFVLVAAIDDDDERVQEIYDVVFCRDPLKAYFNFTLFEVAKKDVT